MKTQEKNLTDKYIEVFNKINKKIIEEIKTKNSESTFFVLLHKYRSIFIDFLLETLKNIDIVVLSINDMDYFITESCLCLNDLSERLNTELQKLESCGKIIIKAFSNHFENGHNLFEQLSNPRCFLYLEVQCPYYYWCFSFNLFYNDKSFKIKKTEGETR